MISGEVLEMELLELVMIGAVVGLFFAIGALHSARVVLEILLMLLRHVRDECRVIRKELIKMVRVLTEKEENSNLP